MIVECVGFIMFSDRFCDHIMNIVDMNIRL